MALAKRMDGGREVGRKWERGRDKATRAEQTKVSREVRVHGYI